MKALKTLTPSAQIEVKALRRAKAARQTYRVLAAQYDRDADAYEAEFAKAETRPDLADPRDPAVIARRAAFVQGLRDTAADILAAAPTE